MRWRTPSQTQAKRFLNVSLTTYQKYSKLYKDEESGKNLWDLHKNQRGKGVKKPYNVTQGKYPGEWHFRW